MRYLSLFSGIEACTMAWHDLGWEPVAFCEFDKFPSEVLAHHYPDVPNLGDVTQITDEQIKALGRIDLVVGGSPCQDLSVAGKRAGLAGERSGLFHEQLRIFHAARSFCGARYLLWENVPGAYSSHKGRDFAIVVGAMAGCRLRVPRNGWQTAGACLGPNGLVEWRCLDAQYVRVESFAGAVPQRRRRVFALLDTGDWASRRPILLEREGLQRHPAPRRETGQTTAHSVAPCIGASGRGFERDGETRGQDPVVAHTLKAEGFDASEDGTGRGTPLVPEVCGTMKSCKDSGGWSNSADHAAAGYMVPTVANPLTQRMHKGINTTCDEGQAPIPVAIPINTQLGLRGANTSNSSREGLGIGREGDAAFTLQAAHHHAVAFAHQAGGTQTTLGYNPESGTAPTLAKSQTPAIAFAQNQRDEVRTMDVAGALAAEPGMKQQTYLAEPFTIMERGRDGGQSLESRQDGTANAILTPNGGRGGMGVGAIATPMHVRRLTVEECESLQGFPRGFTKIPWRGKPAEKCPDGPRYKALGNSMAVNVMAWIGRRIQGDK